MCTLCFLVYFLHLRLKRFCNILLLLDVQDNASMLLFQLQYRDGYSYTAALLKTHTLGFLPFPYFADFA